MSIRKRLAFFVVLMTGLLSVLGGTIYMGFPVVLGGFRQSLDSMDSLTAIRELKASVQRQRTSLNQYLLLGDRQELSHFEASSSAAAKNLEEISSKFLDHPPEWLPGLETLFEKSSAASMEVAKLYKRGYKTKAYDKATNDLFPKFQSLFDRVNEIERDNSLRAERLFRKMQGLSHKVGYFIIGIFVVGLLMGLLLFRSLYQAVMKPLETLRKGAQEFGKGDWDHRIELSSKNEFGSLAQSFNTMADNVKQLQMQAVHMDRMSAVGQLAGGVAHEINNPLTAVLGQAQILLAKMEDTDPRVNQLKKIENAAIRCRKIVRGLLDFSRPSSLTSEKIDVNNVVVSTLELCEADLKKGKIIIDKRINNAIPTIQGNQSELQQVLLNLINNAIQAMPRGGNVTIHTKTYKKTMNVADPKKKNVTHPVNGTWVEIGVKDTGVGIPREHLGRVFEPFFTTKEIGKGTGLGLAVSMGIVQKHGGMLHVDSEGLNRGATFSLVLPVKNAQAGASSMSSGSGMAA